MAVGSAAFAQRGAGCLLSPHRSHTTGTVCYLYQSFGPHPHFATEGIRRWRGTLRCGVSQLNDTNMIVEFTGCDHILIGSYSFPALLHATTCKVNIIKK